MLEALLRVAGIGQLALALGSLAIPRTLGWRAELAAVRPLTRQIFWTYAGYIFSFNVSFGVLSALAPGLLLERRPLAAAVAAFIALYWGARLVIQLVYYDRSIARTALRYRAADVAAIFGFAALALVYAAAFLADVGTLAL